jgi:MFS family permease
MQIRTTPSGPESLGTGALAPLRHQSEWVILAASFSINLGVQYVSPLLPAMASDLHLTTVQIGWVVGGYALPSLALTLPLGVLADFWGPKRMLVAALVVFGASGVAVITATSFEQLLLWRVIQGVAFAPLATLTISMIAETVPLRHQAMAQGYRSVVGSASEFVLPLLAGILLATSGSWRPAFLLLIAPVVIGAWAALVLPTATPARRARRGYVTQAAAAVREPAILGVMIGGFARWFLKYGFFAYVPIYLSSRLHAHAVETGAVIAIPGLVAAVVASQTGRLGLGRRASTSLMVGLIAFGVCLPAFTLVPTIWWVAGVAVVQGVADGVIGPLLNSFISTLPTSTVRVAVVSFSGLLRNIGKTVAPTVLGPLVLLLGYPLAFGMVSLVAVTAGVYLLPLLRSHMDKASPTTAGTG